ncbi:MAG: DUF4070 domain-containing protein [bacterium]
MKILLVYPKNPETFWSFKHIMKFVARKAAFPPLGLLTVGAMLPEKWQKKLIDMNVSALRDEDIDWADMVFISAMIVQKDSASEVVQRCKKVGKTIVVGGPLFSSQDNHWQDVDHYVLNEAEITLPLFLKDLAEGRPKRVYTSQERPDITLTPLPMWSLIDLKKYVTMPVQYSRGCPYNCEFCDIIIMNGRKPRTKTPSQMIAEIQSLYEAGWRGAIFIVDDNFIGNSPKVKKMLPFLIDWQKRMKYPFTFLTEASTDLAQDKELLELMSAANFYKVFIGLETPDLNSLKECGKYQNMNMDLKTAVQTIHQHGMQVMGGFIVGFDNDTSTVFDSQIKFIQQIGVVTAMVGILTALPRTRLWHRLKGENRLLGESSGENTGDSINFIPRMGVDKLQEGYRNLIATIYSPKYYYRRIDTFIKSYKPCVVTKLHLQDIRAFLRSTWRIGIFSRARIHYWKLLIKTFLTRIRCLPIATELAIMGLHFDKVSRATASVSARKKEPL